MACAAAGTGLPPDGPGPGRSCRAGLIAGSPGGQRPGAVPAGQALADQGAQVHRGGAALEPGVVPGHPAVAELEAAAPEDGHLGDGAFHVGPVSHVVLAQPGVRGPVRAGGAQQVIAGVQDELAAGLAGCALRAQRAVPAGRVEGGDAGRLSMTVCPAGQVTGAGLLIDGEIIDGEAALDRACSGLGLITARCPASLRAPRRSPVP